MGNVGSNGARTRRRSNSGRAGPQPIAGPHALPPLAPQPQPDAMAGNSYVFAAASPYPPPHTNHPPYYNYPGYYPQPPMPAPVLHGGPSDGLMLPHPMNWGPPPRYALPHLQQRPPPYIEHQKAVTIRNDVNVKKETLRMEADAGNPGKFVVAFTFDATIAGSITIVFFAKEGLECNLTPMKESLIPPVIVTFKEGLSQNFRQPSGTGIDFSMFDETELLKEGETEVYPLAVKAETCSDGQGTTGGNHQNNGTSNSQITHSVFEKKENGEYHARVVKQLLWVGGIRYELQEIYGIGNSVDNEFDGSDLGKDCVICLSEPRDTTVLPCRHMCMCSECAKELRLRSNTCPICRQPVERLLEIKVNNKNAEERGSIPAE